MKVLLLLPAGEQVRVTDPGRVPRRKMLRFSLLSLTTVAALTPEGHSVRICDENVEPVDDVGGLEGFRRREAAEVRSDHDRDLTLEISKAGRKSGSAAR